MGSTRFYEFFPFSSRHLLLRANERAGQFVDKSEFCSDLNFGI
jgi:hypothetical protein